MQKLTTTTRKLTKEFVASIKPTGTRLTFRDTECRGLLLRVGASGRKSWAFDYRDPDGKRQTYRIGDADRIDPGAARKKVRSLGEDPAGDKRRNRDASRRSVGRTLKMFLEGRYLTDYLVHRKSGNATEQRIRAAWAPYINTDMAQLDPAKIARYRAERLAGGVKPQTLNRDRTALLALLNKAVEWRILDFNPLDDPAFKPLETADHKRVRWLGQMDEHEDVHDPETGGKLSERERFHQALKMAPPYLRQIVRLALNTGLRRGEIFKLSWKDVSLKRRELVVQASTAKTNKTRHVPLNDEAVDALEEAGKVRHLNGYVFVNPDTEKPFDNVKRSWQTVVKQSRLQDFTFHDLRHDYASRLVQAGVDLYVVRDLLGHSSIQLTERYAHLRPEAKHAAVAVLVDGESA